MSYVPRKPALPVTQSWSCKECGKPWFQSTSKWPPRKCVFCGSPRTVRG